MFCSNCGNHVDDNSSFCASCGHQLNSGNANVQQTTSQVQANQPVQQVYTPYVQQQVVDGGSVGWGFLGFFFPLVGLILFCVWKAEKPKSAKMAGIGALISVCVSVFFGIVMGIILAACPDIAQNFFNYWLS